MSTQIATAASVYQASTVALSGPVTAPALRQFSVETYHQMIESGVLTTNDRVQLIDGLIIAMPPIGPPHAASTMLADAALRRQLPNAWIVRTQMPITLAQSEPEPDIVIARGEIRNYVNRHPGPQEVAIVIEIADSTLEFDRQQKLRIYSEAGIPQYWVLNLADRQLEVHRDPHPAATGAEYRMREVIDSNGSVDVVLDEKRVAQLKVSELLP